MSVSISLCGLLRYYRSQTYDFDYIFVLSQTDQVCFMYVYYLNFDKIPLSTGGMLVRNIIYTCPEIYC